MAQSSLFSSNSPNYVGFLKSAQNTDGLAGTARPNVAGRSYRLSDMLKQSPLQPTAVENSEAAPVYDDAFFDNAGQQPDYRTDKGTSLMQRLKSWGSNWGRDKDGKVNAEGSPLMRDAVAAGELGLGVASFLEQRKTARLQRDALRHDIETAKEHRANRQALGDSWNRAWGK